MSQPPQGERGPQGGQPPEGQGDPGAQGGTRPPAGAGPQGPRPPVPGPQGHPPQPGQPGYPARPGPQGYPPQPGPQGYPPQPGQPGYPVQPGQPGYPPQGYPAQPGRQGFPPQGYPKQPGYPGQPYGGAPGPQAGGYGFVPPPGGPQPYQPGAQPPGQPTKKRTGLFVLIGAGALALILAIVAIAVNLRGDNDTAGGGGATGGNGGASTSSAPAALPSDAVAGFLQALVQQDPQKALGYAADPTSVDTSLMTPAMLASSAKLAPLANVQVPPVTDKDATTVATTYTLGATPVTATYDVIKVGDDWKLSQVAAPVDVTFAQDPAVPMFVNGVRVKNGSLMLLPGAYRFTTGQRNHDYGRHPDVVVQSPSDTPDASQLAPQINSKGRATALKAIKKSWSSCLDKHAQKPKGCPNQFQYKDFKFKNSTVRWSQKGSNPFKKIKPDYTDITTLQYYVKRDLALKGTCKASGRTGSCTGTLKGTVQVEARFKGDKIKVEWLV